MPFSSITSLNIYKNNPFRITGLPVNASTREIAKLISGLKISAALGGREQTFAFALQPDEEKIRNAAQKLKDIESRFISSFFWFWPEPGEGGENDGAIQALNRGDHNAAGDIWLEREEHARTGFIAKHNLAVMHHLIALDWTLYQFDEEIESERAAKILDLWRESLERWKTLLSCEALWDYLREQIRQINDDRLKTGIIRRMEKSLAECLAKINAEAALQYAQRGRTEFANEQIRMMRAWFSTASDADKVSEWVLDSETKVIQRGVEKVKAENDPIRAIEGVRQLIEICQHDQFLFGLFYSKDAHQIVELFNDVGWACNRSIVAYEKATQDYPTCAELLKKVMPFARDEKLHEFVSGNIGIYERLLKNKPLEDLMIKLKEICDSGPFPKSILSQIEAVILPQFNSIVQNTESPRREFADYFDAIAIALRGVSLEAWNTHKDKKTALKACKLALSFVVSSDWKKKLEEDQRTLAAQKSENAGCLWVLGVIGFFVIVGLFNSNNSSSRTTSSTSYTAPTPYSASTPVYYSTPRPAYSTPPSAYSAPTPVYSTPIYEHVVKRADGHYYPEAGYAWLNPNSPNDFRVVKSADPQPTPARTYSTPRPTYSTPSAGYSGNATTYRVPHSRDAELNSDLQAINVAKAQAKSYSAQINSLASEINRERSFLDRSNQYEVNDFNEKVDRYNAMLEQQKALNRRVNQMVDAYNAKLQLYGR